MEPIVLVGMGIVSASWVLLFGLFSGIGNLICRLFGFATWRPESWFSRFWMGLAAIIALLQIWNFWLPVDWRSGLLVGVLGAVGMIVQLRTVTKRTLLNRTMLVWLLLLLPVAGWIAQATMGAPQNGGSGLYHFSKISWLSQYAMVPGLGNLSNKLAFNQSFFLYAAMLDISPFVNQGYRLANSLPVAVLIAQLAYSLSRFLYERQQASPVTVFQALLFVPVFYFVRVMESIYTNLASPSPDLFIIVLSIVLFITFIDFLWSPSAEQLFLVFYILVLTSIAISVKLSAIALGLTILGLTGAIWVIRQPRLRIPTLRLFLIWVVILGLGVGGPWVIHGIATSGYPAYPSTLLAMPVDWRMPSFVAELEADAIRGWARDPSENWPQSLANWDWLPGWWERVRNDKLVYLPFGLLVAGGMFSLGVAIVRRPFPRDRRLWVPLVPLGVALIFWFMSAPDPQFAVSVFWLLGVWALFVPIYAARFLQSRLVVTLVMIVCIGASLLALRELVLVPRILTIGTIPQGQLTRYTTAYELELYGPVQGAAPMANICWRAPLPCAPYFPPRLQQRGAALDEGFRYGTTPPTTVPPGVEVGAGLGFAFRGGWYQFEPAYGVRWMQQTGYLWLYSDTATNVQFSVTPGVMFTGTQFEHEGGKGTLAIQVDQGENQLIEVTYGTTENVTLALQPGFNGVTLEWLPGAIVPAAVSPENLETRSLGIAFSRLEVTSVE